MANITYNIREYSRDEWCLQDLRDIVGDTTTWDANTKVFLTAPQPRSEHGTIEVVVSE